MLEIGLEIECSVADLETAVHDSHHLDCHYHALLNNDGNNNKSAAIMDAVVVSLVALLTAIPEL